MSHTERKCLLCGDPAEWVSHYHRADTGLCRTCQVVVAKRLADVPSFGTVQARVPMKLHADVAVDDLFAAWNAVHPGPPIVITNIVNS